MPEALFEFDPQMKDPAPNPEQQQKEPYFRSNQGVIFRDYEAQLDQARFEKGLKDGEEAHFDS